jgi:hypothetical protein
MISAFSHRERLLKRAGQLKRATGPSAPPDPSGQGSERRQRSERARGPQRLNPARQRGTRTRRAQAEMINHLASLQ